MNRALSSLGVAIESGLQRQSQRFGEASLSPLTALKRAAVDLAQRFDQVEKALVPPSEKRQEALRKFKRTLNLTASEWRLVFSGLADDDEVNLPVLEDDALFQRVHGEVGQRIEERRLSRRDWLALCFSYFSYDAREPSNNTNWLALRSNINRGFDAVCQATGREKEWMRIVTAHRDVFGDAAGRKLAEDIFEGGARDLSALQTIAQVPDSSWLWQRIFTVLLSRIFTLDDDTFYRRLPELVSFGQLNTRYLDQVLGACLTRYHKSRYREQSSTLLKQAALEHWGSPQVHSRQNAWLHHVEQPVCAMVLAWFAKEDLEHFFTLLKGEADVDQSRLFYWLRFANQMSYTRIVMGNDAWYDRSSDFVAFRQKNKGRLSQLSGGPSHNNAVIMQLGDYYFVEFSGTGNACYVYRAETAPFNPDRPVLGLNDELKQQSIALLRMRHFPAPARPNMVEGWLEKFDDELRRLGITVAGITPMAQPQPFRHRPSAAPAAPIAPSPKVATQPVAENQYSLSARVKSALGDAGYKMVDSRSKGGAFKVVLDGNSEGARTALLKLGFQQTRKDPLVFWRE